MKTTQYLTDKEQKASLEEKLGGYNSMPPNWTEINEGEFLWRFCQKHANGYQDFRQVKLPSTGYHGDKRASWCHVYLWINMDLAGVGMIVHYNGRCADEDHGYHPQYFKFEYCQHEFETTVSRMCYWEGKCKKCGYVKAIDSSD